MPERPQRGVWEYDAPFQGYKTYTVVTSAGRVLMRVDVLGDLVTESFIENLWRFLDRQDRRADLRII